MYLQIRNNYHHFNQILYVLKSIESYSSLPLSKLGLQKLLYFAAVLAPIKKVILSIIQFKRDQRGPYSKEIQNTVDHLVAYGLVEIVEFKKVYKNNSLAYYRITDGGKRAVEKLIKIDTEEEKYWWINLITHISYLFSKEEDLSKEDDFGGIDNIVKLVYQDLEFKVFEDQFGASINETSSSASSRLVNFTKEFIDLNYDGFLDVSERSIIELVLVAYFEFLYGRYLTNLN